MFKLLIGAVLGISLYLSLSLYQPMTEANAASAQVSQTKFSFESPIPYDLIINH